MAHDPDLQIHKISGAVPPLGAPESPPGVPLTPAPGGHPLAGDAAEKPRFVEPIFLRKPKVVASAYFVTVYVDRATGLEQSPGFLHHSLFEAKLSVALTSNRRHRPAYLLVIRPKQVPA